MPLTTYNKAHLSRTTYIHLQWRSDTKTVTRAEKVAEVDTGSDALISVYHNSLLQTK